MNNKENNAVISNMESENLDEHDERQFSYGKMPNCLPAPSQTSGQILANKNNGYANNNNTSLNCIADNKKTLLTQKSLPSEDSNNYGNKCYESINSQDGKAYPSSGSNHSSNGSNSNGNSTSCSITAQRLLKDVKDLALKNQKTEQSLRELQRKINLQKTKKTRNQQDDKENLAAITGDKKLSRNNSQQNQPYSSYNENYTSSYSTNNTSVNNAGSSNNTNSLNNANYNKGQQYQQQQQGASILTQNSNYQNIYHKHSQGTTNSTNANELNANANGYQKNKIPILNYKSQHDQLKQQQASSDYLHQLKVIQQQEQQKQQAQQLQLQQLQQIQQQKQQAQQIQQQQLQKQQQLLQQQQQAKKNTTKARFVEKNFSDQQLDKMNNNRNLNQKENVFRQHENLYQQQVQQQKLKELQLRDDESHKIKQVEHTFLQQQAIQQQQLQAQFDQYQTHSSKRDEHVDRVMREETISSKLARLIINQNYSQEILQYITANEDKFCPQNCLQNHGITVSLRAKMVDWMIEVMKSYHCSEESYFMAVRLMDTFLEKSKTRKEPSDLHLIGVTCIFVACKYEEIYPLRLEVTSDKIAHRKLSPEQIKECEAEILTTLDFNLLGTSPYEITMHTLTLIGLQDRLQNSEFQYSHKICLYLCKMVLYDYDFFRKIPYSLMSAALIYISFKIISQFEQEFFAEAYIKPVIQVLKVETKQLIEVSTRILSLAKSFDQYFPDLKNLKKFNGFEPTSYEIDEIKKIQLKKEDKSKREEQKRSDSNYEQMSEELKDEMRDEKEELSLKDDLKEQMKEELKDETE